MRTAPLRFLLAVTLALQAASRSGVAEPPDPAETFRATFTADYTVEAAAAAAPAGAAAYAPARTRSWAFTSRKGTRGPGGTTYRRFRLRVLSYDAEAAALQALRRLAEESAGDMFRKSPLLAFTAGPDLYQLDGACLFPPAEWNAVEERLLGSFPAAPAEPPGPRLRIACGGAVEESPLPAVRK